MFEWKIIQYDISRGRVPKIETILRRIDLLRPYGLNGVALYIESPIATNTFPSVNCGQTPVTKAWLSELRNASQQRGVALVPILQILGHQAGLLALDEFEPYAEIDAPKKAKANNFTLGNPQCGKLVKQWLGELLEYFNAPWVHVGCDEIFTLGLGRSAQYLSRMGVEAAMTEYFNDIYAWLHSQNRQMVLYADMLIHFPALKPLLREEIIISNWGYGRWKDVYELDNGHFASHATVTRGRRNWVVGNNMAEYIFPPFQRLTANTDIWIELGGQSHAEAFMISDWGSYDNVNPHVLSLMGDAYILMRLADKELSIETFLREFSHMILGRSDENFINALKLMGEIQMDTTVVTDERLQALLPIFPKLLLGDPASASSSSRCMASLRDEGLQHLETQTRHAAELIAKVSADGAPHPDYLDDLQMLAHRLVMIALRGRLWVETAWDSGCIWLTRETLEPRMQTLREYVALSEADEQWYSESWGRENHPSCVESCRESLKTAREVMSRRIQTMHMDNTLLHFEPCGRNPSFDA